MVDTVSDKMSKLSTEDKNGSGKDTNPEAIRLLSAPTEKFLCRLADNSP